MPVATDDLLENYCAQVAKNAKLASRILCGLPGETKNQWLVECANQLEIQSASIVAANQLDLDKAAEYDLTPAELDRLRLSVAGVSQLAKGLREIAAFPDPVGELIEGSVRPNGLRLSKVRVPLGVVFFIYESRPNVTADAAAIAVKSGNAIILRGGKEAMHSSKAIVSIMQSVATTVGIPIDAVQLVNTTERDAVGHFLKYDQWIDLAIPRGGEGLIRRVVSEAKMPVLKHYDGNCHMYIDQYADIEKSLNVVENSKCQRMGVCNALESLVVHHAIASEFLPKLLSRLAPYKIEFRGDEESLLVLKSGVRATESDWSKEYLGPILSVRVVGTIDEAIEHINQYSSHHTDGIMTEDVASSQRFTALVDSAAVVVNASTRFNDGGQLGLGAEIGISTDKFHARGPCGIRELTTYKYIVHGDGHVRT